MTFNTWDFILKIIINNFIYSCMKIHFDLVPAFSSHCPEESYAKDKQIDESVRGGLVFNFCYPFLAEVCSTEGR